MGRLRVLCRWVAMTNQHFSKWPIIIEWPVTHRSSLSDGFPDTFFSPDLTASLGDDLGLLRDDDDAEPGLRWGDDVGALYRILGDDVFFGALFDELNRLLKLKNTQQSISTFAMYFQHCLPESRESVLNEKGVGRVCGTTNDPSETVPATNWRTRNHQLYKTCWTDTRQNVDKVCN